MRRKKLVIMTGCLDCSFYGVVSRFVRYSQFDWLVSNFSRGVVNVTDTTSFYKVFCRDDMHAVAWTDTWFNDVRPCDKSYKYVNIATSEYNADMMRRAGIRVDDVIPRPVPDNFYETSDVVKKSIEFLVVGTDSPYPVDKLPVKYRAFTVGNMLDRKGIRQTVRVLYQLGLLRQSLIKTNVNLPYPSVTTPSGTWYGKTELAFNKKMSDDDMLSLYRQAKFYLATSYVEGFGLPPWEAMAVGVPVIYINAHAFRNLVGIPIDEYDVIELPGVTLHVPSDVAVKRAIEHAMSMSRDEYDDLSAKSREFAKKAKASDVVKRVETYVRQIVQD